MINDLQKEGYKKWRVYIITKENVHIFTKKNEKIENEEENNTERKGHKLNHNTKETKSLTKIKIAKKDDIKMPYYKYKFEDNNNYHNNYVIYGKGKYIALGGYWNGNIIVKNLRKKLWKK